MKNLFLLILILPISLICQVNQFRSIGIGGGGALFFPSPNPNNEQEVYVSCDLSSMYQSMEAGLNWKLQHHQQIQGGNYSKVCFTIDNNIRYAISYKPDGYDDRAAPVKSTDGGISWSKCAGNPDPTEFLDAIYVNYNNPNQVIISQKTKLFISQNGGNSFNAIYTAKNFTLGLQSGGAFFDGNSIYIATIDGIIRSTNNGSTFALWTNSGIPSGTGIISFCAARTGASLRFFALTGVLNLLNGEDDNDLFLFDNLVNNVISMDDASGVWVTKNTGVQFSNHHVKFIAMAENNINTIYIGGLQYINGDANVRHPLILKSVNAGANWSSVFNSVNNANIRTGYSGDGGDEGWWYGEYVLGLSVHPRNAEICYFTDLGFIHSTKNGGTLWNQLYVNPSQENNQNAKIPRYKTYRSNGDLNQVSAWQIHWIDQNNLWTCLSDIKGTRTSDAGENWSFDYTGHQDNTSYRIVPSNDKKTLYMATSKIHDLYQSTYLNDDKLDRSDITGEVKFSKDNGKTWTAMSNFSDIIAWVATHPNEDNTLYAARVNSTVGVGGIWQTKNANAGASVTWTKLPDPPRTEGHPYNIIVLNDGKILATYSGHRDPNFTASSGVFLFDPATNSWSDRSHAGMRYWTKDVVVDPHDPTQNTWYVGVFSGWGVAASQNVGGLYKTTDRGLTWTRIFNHERVESATISPTNPNEIYVSTEVGGLYYSSNVNSNLPTFQLTDYPFRHPMRIFFNPYKPEELWITSFGQGVIIANKKSTTGIDIKKEDISFEIYPNPAKDNIYIYAKNNPGAVIITNYSGQQIHMDVKKVGENLNQINVQKLKPGMYFIHLGSTSKSWIKL
ncbi:MAG: T9SS type A sorting domain-containing protein [Saprospiraceae bacterium]